MQVYIGGEISDVTWFTGKSSYSSHTTYVYVLWAHCDENEQQRADTGLRMVRLAPEIDETGSIVTPGVRAPALGNIVFSLLTPYKLFHSIQPISQVWSNFALLFRGAICSTVCISYSIFPAITAPQFGSCLFLSKSFHVDVYLASPV